jgi:nucleotide-binding universal stress UspA family protein
MAQRPAGPARRRIVIAIDPQQLPLDPLQLGGRLAGILGAPVVLATVFPYTSVLQDPDDESLRSVREAARNDLLELGRSLTGVTVADAEVLPGTSPARALQELSEREDAAVIVIGSTTRGPLRRLLPGSVGDRLLAGAACPVAVAPHGYGDHAPDELKLAGAAYDGSEESRSALDAARALASRAGGRLRIVTVHQPLAFGGVPVLADMPAASVNEVVERELREVHEAAVAESREELDVEGVFEIGSPGEVLAAQSRELDLLTTGSRGYGPVGAVLLGSTTHPLVRSAECPLLVTPRGRRLELDEAG